MTTEKQDTFTQKNKKPQTKPGPNRDRFIPTRPVSQTEREMQEALFAGTFDIPATREADILFHTMFGFSLTTLQRSRVLNFKLPEPESLMLKRREFSALDNIRILDAPNLVSDAYYNPLCWSELVYLGLGNTTYSYDLQTKSVRKVNEASATISALSCSNKFITQATTDSSLHFIDAQTYSQTSVNNLAIFTKIIPDASSSGTYLLGYRAENAPHRQYTVSHYDVRSGRMTFHITSFGERFAGLAFDKRNTLALGIGDSVGLWDVRKLHEPRLSFTGHTTVSKAIAFSPEDPKKIVTGGEVEDKTLQLWDVTSGTVLAQATTEGPVCDIHWITQHGFFATQGVGNPSISCWSKEGRRLVKEQSTAVPEQVLHSAQNPQDPCAIATTLADESLKFWSVKKEKKEEKESKLEGVSSLQWPVIR
ncbi:WD40 repeat domain-containing protein [Legionella fallonii]|uniref:Uncharacterized protein n=1 Tax=Legionella fallonii LLAP-10 TaxID=1212491 RepID=A0A098GA29_9GAMM|nr:WD40 repeat domain-containing protein [Legionella fallonii]CEG58842.1 protein of unknown function [WD40 repeat domain] [Legionella fallonii LLAP-10]